MGHSAAHYVFISDLINEYVKGIMTALPYTTFFFVVFLIVLTFFFLTSQRDVKIINKKGYHDLFDVEYYGGFEELFQFFPHSNIQKIRERKDDASSRNSR